jgi:hypothetical protein
MIDNILFQILVEQNVLRTTQTKPIVDAIKNKRKITFDYYGPQKPKKDSVRPGRRIKVEPYAIGLSKKGNLILRAWIEPPSVSKKGFDKTKWRTFMITRMRNITITDETYPGNRPGYKEGNDKSMSVTYVSLDMSTQPKEIKPKEPIKKIEPKLQTQQKPLKKELPQPKQKEEPQALPKKELPQPKQKEKPTNTPTEPEQKEPEQKNQQELPQPKKDEKPENKIDNNLQERLIRMKSLMFS